MELKRVELSGGESLIPCRIHTEEEAERREIKEKENPKVEEIREIVIMHIFFCH